MVEVSFEISVVSEGIKTPVPLVRHLVKFEISVVSEGIKT